MYADNREKYLGYAEAVTGVGLMLGPVIGGPLYDAFGYFWSFAVFGLMLLVSMMIAMFITPSALNDSAEEDQDVVPGELESQVSFKMFLLNKRSLFALTSCMIVCFFMSY